MNMTIIQMCSTATHEVLHTEAKESKDYACNKEKKEKLLAKLKFA